MSEKKSKFSKTFSSIDQPEEMQKARQIMEDAIAAKNAKEKTEDVVETPVIPPPPLPTMTTSATLDRQAVVAEKFESGMDKITDVLLVVGMKLSRTATLVIVGVVGGGLMIATVVLSSLLLFNRLGSINDNLKYTVEHIERVEANQNLNEVRISKAVKKAEEAAQRAENAAKTAVKSKEEVQQDYADLMPDKTRQVVLPEDSLK